MKIEYKIIILSIMFGLTVWVLDAAIDARYFYERTFTELLITDVSIHELAIRSIIMATFIIFGILMSIVISKRKRVEEKLRRSDVYLQSLLVFQSCPEYL